MHIDMTMRRPDGVSPAAGDPVAHMLAIAALCPRGDVERAIDAMIEALDAADGDADTEDGHDAEPFTAPDHFHLRGGERYGSDDDEPDDDDCCTAADDDPRRHLLGLDPDEADAEGGTWEHHGERRPDQISASHGDDHEPDETSFRQRHVDRIRRTRCRVYQQFGLPRYSLDGRYKAVAL